jgi:glc operon protein GlcG
MKLARLPLALLTAFVLTQPATTAQDAPPSYGPAITLEQAKKVAAAAEAEARRNKWNVVIAVMDSSANLVLLHRMDDTQMASIHIAQKKAYTAAAFRRSTKVFEDGLAGNVKALGIEQVIPVEGGLPLTMNGKIVGAIGVSGVTSQQDGVIAKAGVDALK